jgi:hypothetical protein
MIDLETLSTRTDAVMLSIGAVVFTADQDEHGYPRKQFYALPNLHSQQKVGLHIEPNTLRWWLKQSNEARSEFDMDDNKLISIQEVLMKLTQFIWDHKPRRIWSHGATFDLPILAMAYAKCRMDCPIRYWDARDTRTLFDLLGEPKNGTLGQLLKPSGETIHNAVIDCENQANAVNYAWRKLKGGL